MGKKARRIISVIIAALGVIELVMVIREGAASAIWLGIGFCLIGGLYYFTSRSGD